jgi:cob(I)alamin adenosyltransferase
VINAISDALLEEEAVLGLLDKRGKTHLILTGRGVSQSLIDKADLVTEMKKIKHPFDSGKLAVRGLDY